jgi:Zn ribbon nucleic-acid-binding protein
LCGIIKKEEWMTQKIICPKCKGNGYITVWFQNEKDPSFEDCKYCNNQGELTEKEVNKKMEYERMQQ